MKIIKHHSLQTESLLDPVRRNLLKAIPMLAIAPGLLAQSSADSIAVRKLHSFGLRVSDVDRSIKFYQDLFGAAIQSRQGDTVCLRIGDGPRFFSLAPLRSGEQVGISHIGLGIADFDLDAVQRQLADFGITGISPPDSKQPALDAAMHSWVKTRGVDEGGANPVSRDLYFADIEGLVYQLSALDFCAGSGPQGNVCERLEAAPVAGLFKSVEVSHFTNFLANRDRANEFYTRIFGLGFQAYQGPTSPIVGVGDGIQFLMYVGGNQDGVPTQPGRIDHVCLSIEDFSVDGILSKLSDYGLSARENAGNTPPLAHWVSMRMPNRGGIAGGTPEVYFSDPDGIHIQLQSTSYCGGGGYFGDECEPLA